MNKDKNSANDLAVALASLLFSGINVALRGWAVTWLWRWFAVPTFGVKELTATMALGLVLLVEILTPTAYTNPENESSDTATKLGKKIGTTLGILLAGWVIHFFA